WFDQNRVVFEDDGRNDALAGIPSQYVGFPFLVLFDVHPFVRNELLAQEFLGPAAIRAPVRARDSDLNLSHGALQRELEPRTARPASRYSLSSQSIRMKGRRQSDLSRQTLQELQPSQTSARNSGYPLLEFCARPVLIALT